MEVLDKYDDVEIKKVEGQATPVYNVKVPKLTPKEKELLEDYKKVVPSSEIELIRGEPDVSARWEILRKKVEKKIPNSKNKEFVVKKLMGLAFGYGEIGLLVADDNLEEIMINGIGVPVYVFHRKHSMCKTNISFATTDAINQVIYDLCYINKKEQKDIVDIAAIDGNRINITAGALPSKGSTITIRKQRREVFSVIELIEKGTLSTDLASFLWLAVEGMKLTPANIVIAGSIGSGKTTTLNALCTFIPPNERVVTIEDTFELNIDNIDNKIQLQATSDYDMDALLRDTLRMRPDRVMVGEIRGKEAITLFNAMNIGRVGMGTLHSSSAREVASRLESPPMSVPPNVVGSLDLILVQNRFLHNGNVVRRVTEVSEVTGAIKDTIMMGEIYRWDPEADEVIRSSEQDLSTPILFIDKLSKATKLDKNKIVREMELRRAVLLYMLRKGIKSQEEVKEFIRRFYLDLEGLIKDVPDLFGEDNQPQTE
jgi:flagellar protein FlaI